MYGLLTKCEVKMAGYWPSSFFGCLWTETKSRSINTQKRTRPIFSHLDRTNLVNKGFIIWLLVKFCLRDAEGSPERARWLHLARLGSQSQRAIWFILPAHGASHVISIIIAQFLLSVAMLKVWGFYETWESLPRWYNNSEDARFFHEFTGTIITHSWLTNQIFHSESDV